MKVVIQRVKSSKVEVNNKIIGQIDHGILVLIGVAVNDEKTDAEWISNKVLNLRIFDDENGVMNRSLIDVKENLLVISQFTLIASTKKGNRPSYINSAGHEIAIPLYEYFIKICEEKIGRKVISGEFGADMKVSLINDGPVTIVIDSKVKD
jgi:D-tyrosyl-tRNA(Tyr) deacylase